jgi:hypothetical protein
MIPPSKRSGNVPSFVSLNSTVITPNLAGAVSDLNGFAVFHLNGFAVLRFCNFSSWNKHEMLQPRRQFLRGFILKSAQYREMCPSWMIQIYMAGVAVFLQF